jgi:hypothetical protein
LPIEPKPDTAAAQAVERDIDAAKTAVEAQIEQMKPDVFINQTLLYPPDPGMLAAAEQALASHQAQVKEFERQKALRERLFNVMYAFRRHPIGDTFIRLLSEWENANSRINERRILYQFIVETLRPGGLPRDGPFVWCSTGKDPTEFEDPTVEQIKMATKSILTPPGVASFINLKTPRAVVIGGELRYSLTIIFDKAAQARPEFAALQRGIDDALRDKWPARLPVGLKSPFHDGAEKAGVYDGYKAGDIFISPWSKDQPGAVNVQKQDIIDWSEFYAGWLVRANVRPFAYDQGGNRGCSFFLESVQFLKPGKRLDGRRAASESFPDDEVGSDDEPV